VATINSTASSERMASEDGVGERAVTVDGDHRPNQAVLGV
jgi:hypothetical protein